MTTSVVERQAQLYGAGRAARLKALELRDKLQSSSVLQDGEYNLTRQKQGAGAWQTCFNADYPGQKLDRAYTIAAISQVARMVIVVAVAFIVAWSPFYLSTLVSQIQSLSGESFLRERNFVFTMLMIHLCGFLNSCINPLIYTGMSKKFRRSFKKILGGCICCRLTYRFLRYRNSLTRGVSAAFTSSLCQSMTEVRDANDLALSEAGSSSGAERSHYQTRSSPHSPASHNNNCLRAHSQQQMQRRSNRARPFNQCGEHALDCPVPVPLSPELTSSKPRGFRLWRSREKREVILQLSLLDTDKGKTKKKVCLKKEKMDGSEIDVKPTQDSYMQEKDKEDRQRFIEDGKENVWRENTLAHTGASILSKPEDILKTRLQPAELQTSDNTILLQTLTFTSTGPSTVLTTPDSTTPTSQCCLDEEKHLQKKYDCPKTSPDESLKDKGSMVKGTGQWGVVTLNGKSCHVAKDGGHDWQKNATKCVAQNKQNSADRTQNQKYMKVSKCSPVQHQHGAVVHTPYAKTGQCVQL